MGILIHVLIYFGSTLMIYNIIRYRGFLRQLRRMESMAELRRSALIPLVLLICFLAGYLTVGFFGKPDLVIALILSGGSIYVSLVLLFLYRIIAQAERNEERLGALYSELRGSLDDLTKDSLSVFRVNLTKDLIEERDGSGLYDSDLAARSYTELTDARREYHLIEQSESEDRLFARDGLIRHFQEGHTTAEEVGFIRAASGQTCFVRRKATLATQPVTGDVIAFITERVNNDEMVNEALLNKALVGQFDMITYLVDGRYGVVIGDRGAAKKGSIFPERNDGWYEDYVQRQLAPVLCGTEEEKAAALAALDAAEVERRLAESEPYEVNLACEIGGETYYKRFVFYTVNREARFYLLLKSDTTDARREELERNRRLQDALEEARRASAAKTVFLSNMSHDIRTPMNAIIGYTNLARRDGNDLEQVRGYLDKIESSSQYLLALINDVLEMSRIESGKLELEPAPVDLRALLDEIRDMFASQMREKGIAFEVSNAELRNGHVLCDKNRLNRVLLNLLSNAYKFTPAGGSVSVTLRQCGGGQEGFGDYELRVRDSGIGMSEEFAARVFDAFERERNSTVSGIQGTGLGMAITKSIVDMMGGTIEVRSEPGQGTEFIIRLNLPLREDAEPSGEADAAPRENGEVPDFGRIRVLLVEDNEINREIAAALLEEMGFLLDTAENGKRAVEKVAASEPGYYGLILMDVQMPVMGGYEAARQIRSLADPALARLPIIAMTANAFSEDIREAEKAGMNGHIAKPLDVPHMRRTLQTVLRQANAAN